MGNNLDHCVYIFQAMKVFVFYTQTIACILNNATKFCIYIYLTYIYINVVSLSVCMCVTRTNYGINENVKNWRKRQKMVFSRQHFSRAGHSPGGYI